MRAVKTMEKHFRKCFQQMNNMCIVAGVHLFLVKVGVEESIVNALRISCLNHTVVCVFTPSGAFTIDNLDRKFK
jgi:hypothetical protein